MKHLNLLWILLTAVCLQAQERDARIAGSTIDLSKVELIQMPLLDNKTLLEAELARRRPGIAPRFAQVLPVDIKPQTHGNWEYKENGKAIWRLRIRSTGAYSLNLGFTQYRMPEGGRLILYSPDYQKVMGPFTPADNEEHAELWTPVLEGDELVVEVQLPKSKIPELQLHLSTVNHDFMGFAQIASGSCNLDVLCGTTDGFEFVEAYRDVIQSVAVYGLQGNLFCTGFLVNNTREDCTPYFMTADHCEVRPGEAPSLVVYWNYQNSFCRELDSAENAGPGDGILNNFNSGAILRASYAPSDMALLELDDPVSESANAYFAGWTRERTPPTKGVASVHHPNAEEKSISYSSLETYLGAWESGADQVPDGDHIIVPDWSVGTTEVGSSGAPLFNESGLVVGQLHGGIADCSAGGYDTFGAFAISWEGGGTPASSLKSWLDPDDTQATSLNGRWQSRCSFFVEALISSQSVCAPGEVVYNLIVSENFSGPVDLTLTGVPEGLQATFGDNPVNPGDTTNLLLQGIDQVAAGLYSFTLIASDGEESVSANLTLNVFQTAPGAVNLLEPSDNATAVGIRANFSWASEPFANRYEFQLATDADFMNIIASVADLGATSLENFDLEALTTYYWRVRGNNLCGIGEWSQVRVFATAGVGCAQARPSDLPITITESANTITSTLRIGAPGLLQDVRIKGLDITHSFVGDLRASLISPSGTEVVLFDQPGLPLLFFGCEGSDLKLSFSDDAANSSTDLEQTCNDRPAIEGDFQPLEAFANFKGESIIGLWTLKIEDLIIEDGGRLNDWTLEFCTSLPQDRNIYTVTDRYQACINEQPISLNLLLGTAFSEPVSLSVSGLPENATVLYNSNPASPGASVGVTIDNITEGGLYDLTFKADTAQARTQLLLIASPPPVTVLTPPNESIVDRERVNLRWNSVPEADFYELRAYEGVVGEEPFLLLNLADTTYTLEDLDFGTAYYWQVVPYNSCGGDESEVFQSFLTRPDLALSVSPERLSLCQTETGSVDIQIGPGFANPSQISYQIDPQDTIGISYNIPSNAVTPGSTVNAAINDLSSLDPGNYLLTFTIGDTVFANQVSINLEVSGLPALSSLAQPENNSTLMNPQPSFSWSEASFAESYRLEISTDPTFGEVLLDTSLEAANFTIGDMLTDGLYFWRISSLNSCGAATSAAFRFNIASTGVEEWEGGALQWYPNPTQGRFFIQFPRPQSSNVDYQIINSLGALIKSGKINPGLQQAVVDLADFPSGLYLIRLQRNDKSAVLRVVKE